MDFLQYNNPLIVALRSGKEDDPYIEVEDTQMIVNGTIILSELPDEISHVLIDGYTEIYKPPIANDNFIVNYTNGIVYFNPLEEGKNVTAKYYGRGNILISASRVYTKLNINGEVTQNVDGAFNILDNQILNLKNVRIHEGDVEPLDTKFWYDSNDN